MGHTILPASEGSISASTIVPPVFATKDDGYAYWNDTPRVETKETDGDGRIDGNSHWWPMLVAFAVIGTVMAVVAILLYTVEQNAGPALELACELPTERPFMTMPTIWNVSIGNEREARAYAILFFPEFSDCEFENWSDSGGYYASLENVSLRIDSDGSLYYHLKEWDTDTRAPPLDLAFELALDFIESHGGIGNYSLVRTGNATVSGDRGEWVNARLFMFHTEFEGFPVLGFDRIHVDVYSNGCDLIRQVHRLVPSNVSDQVISSATAWSVVYEAEKDSFSLRGERITTVGLCYYIDRPFDDEYIVYPAWRFANRDIGLFVNAFTGEIVGGIYP